MLLGLAGIDDLDLDAALIACRWSVPYSWQSLYRGVVEIRRALRTRESPLFEMARRWEKDLHEPRRLFESLDVDDDTLRRCESVDQPDDVVLAKDDEIRDAWTQFTEAALVQEHGRIRWNDVVAESPREPVATNFDRVRVREVLEVCLESARTYERLTEWVEDAGKRFVFPTIETPLPDGIHLAPTSGRPVRPRQQHPDVLRMDWSMPEIYGMLADSWGYVMSAAHLLGDRDLSERSARRSREAALRSADDHKVAQRSMNLAVELTRPASKADLDEAESLLDIAENRYRRAGAMLKLGQVEANRHQLSRARRGEEPSYLTFGTKMYDFDLSTSDRPSTRL